MIVVICVFVTVLGLGILGGMLIQWAVTPKLKPVKPTDTVTAVCDRCGKEVKESETYAECKSEFTDFDLSPAKTFSCDNLALCQKCTQEVFFSDYAKILTKIASSKDFGDATKLDENGTLNTLSQETSR